MSEQILIKHANSEIEFTVSRISIKANEIELTGETENTTTENSDVNLKVNSNGSVSVNSVMVSGL